MIAGITGHQYFEEVDWVEEQMKSLITDYEIKMGWSALAIGADQMFASVLQECRVPFQAILPCSRYRETFDKEGLEKYESLLDKAADTHILDFEEPSEEAFWAAGKYVVDESDILIAVWNGLPARGLGGTGDVVKYAHEMNKPIIHIDYKNKKVGRIKF